MTPARRGRCAAAWVALLLAGCAASRPPPLPFVRSAAYRAMARDVHGVVAADGGDEVAVARATGGGAFRITVLRRAPATPEGWQAACTTAAIDGSELMHLTWLRPPDGAAAVAAVARDADPDEVREQLAVWGGRRCEALLERRLRRPPDGLEGGVGLADGGAALRLVEAADYLTLRGAEGDVRLPVRAQVLTATPEADGSLHTCSVPVDLLRSLPLRAGAAAPTAPFSGAVGLVDGQARTHLRVPPLQRALLRLEATAPIAVVEVTHGCAAAPAAPAAPGEAAAPTVLWVQGEAHPLGELPVAGSSVRAAARRQPRGGDYARDVLVLRRPQPTLLLELEPAPAWQCVREVVAYGAPAVAALTEAACRR